MGEFAAELFLEGFAFVDEEGDGKAIFLEPSRLLGDEIQFVELFSFEVFEFVDRFKGEVTSLVFSDGTGESRMGERGEERLLSRLKLVLALEERLLHINKYKKEKKRKQNKLNDVRFMGMNPRGCYRTVFWQRWRI